ncbi:MAG: glycosyltransferase [Pseudomonadota bacterium]
MATTRRPFSDENLNPQDNKPRRRTKSSYSWSTSKDDKNAKHIRVSIVVPTCGRPALLDRCLEALVDQHIDPASYEIIVVDDGASRETKAVVAQWTARVLGQGPIIGYIGVTKAPHGPAAARNHGWRAANGDVIAFTDDDTVPDVNWLRNSLQAFKGKIHAAWGRIVMPLPEQPTDYELDAQGLQRAEFATANCFCLKRVLEAMNGFDEQFSLPWREDADLYFRLLSYDARVVYIPEAIVIHPVRPAPWGVSISQQKKVFFDALLFKKHRLLYRQKIRATPRWDYYAIVSMLLLLLTGLILQWPALATIAGVIWLALTGRFCRQRLRHTSKSPRHLAEMIVTSAIIPPLAVFWRFAGAVKFRVGFV